ncbi:hypothetical protein Taro_009751 [Colocasia esculenta]|uniref:Pentatricopeptide repeat-containing protein n=1 Tax=Colocasia esculenta TaxID=4460 RepID=A0A843UAX3_COLES|nr:hypothetical protein [Colocasia esculenta]
MERHGNCRGVRPNKYTFPFLLKACVRLWSLSLGSQLHGKISKFGLDSDGFVRNALINFHANCGDLVVADTLFGGPARADVVAWSAMVAGYARRGELDVVRMLFDQMPSKDLISWNVMITGYTRRGEMDKARELFDLVPEKDVVSWNAMIAGYVECRTYEKAMDIYEEMLQVGEWPDEVTMLSLLSACTEIGVLDIGVRMHHSLLEMVHSRHVHFTVTLGNALIDMFRTEALRIPHLDVPWATSALIQGTRDGFLQRTLGVQQPSILAELLSTAQCHAACEESLAAGRAE